MKIKLLIPIFLVCFYSSCIKDTAGFDKEIVIVIDITDPQTVKPDEQAISAHLNLKNDIWQGIQVKITCISELDINPEVIVTLPKGSSWMGNAAIREAQVARFKKEIHDGISKFSTQAKASMDHSIVYRTLAKELTQLAGQPVKDKCALIYGDFMENDSLSFYSPETFSALRTNPAVIQKKLERSCPIGSLRNISIYCLFSPASYNANYQYMVAVGFFKQMFESKGATVYISSSIN